MVRAIVDYDLVVVGSGPAGATAARTAARGGLNVLLVDKKQELGSPIQCSGAVSANALNSVDVLPADEFVLEPVYGFVSYDAAGARRRWTTAGTGANRSDTWSTAAGSTATWRVSPNRRAPRCG